MAPMDVLASQLKQEIDRASADLAQQREDLCAAREALAVEKAAMSQLTPGSAKDLVELNVGGENITTMRRTLTSAKGSKLAAMFSGRWEDKLTLDKEGRVFLDLNPYAVRKIIDYFRLKSASNGTDVPYPNVASDMQAEYLAALDHFGLLNLFALPVVSVATTPTAHVASNPQGSSTHLFNGKETISAYRPVLSAVPIPVGGCWKVHVIELASAGWCCLGILGDTVPANKNHATKAGTSPSAFAFGSPVGNLPGGFILPAPKQPDKTLTNFGGSPVLGSSTTNNPTISDPTCHAWGGKDVIVAGKSEKGPSSLQMVSGSSYYFQLRETELVMVQEVGGNRSVFCMPVTPKIAYKILTIFFTPNTELRLSSLDKADAERVGLVE